jgi:predicted kinase
MISLVQLLKEMQDSPKAIFLAGPAGSGKSYISSQLIPNTFTVINSDDTYEELLKASGIGLKQKDFTPDQLSQAAKLQAQARKVTQSKYEKLIANKDHVILDGTGGALAPLTKKKQQLEDLGYKTLMLMIYVSPLVSLERNQQRDRSLMPGIVLRNWRDVNKNIELYKQAFGNNFILLNNNPKDTNQEFNVDLLEPFIQASTAVGKPKSPEDQAKSDADKAQLNKDIESMVNQLPEFDSMETAKNKVNEFIR